MVRAVIILATAAVIGGVQACWEQCGGEVLSIVQLAVILRADFESYGFSGQGWSGSTTCTSPCVCTYSNPYYSQCLPPSSTTTTKAATTTTNAVTTKATTAATTTTVKTTTTTATTNGGSAPKFWFSFGDSYTQTQFNVNSTLPSSSNVFGNPAFPGYTACGSYTNWIDEMIVKYNTSYLYSYNFAYGGATIDASLVTPYMSTVLSMTDQVREFLNQVGPSSSRTPWSGTNSIFSFFIGINDVSNHYGGGTTSSNAAFCNTLMDAYFALVQKVYNAGGRNFLFINVPPVDRSPLTLGQSTSSQALEKAMITSYNSALSSRAASFQSSNTGSKTWVYDSNTKINQILNSPSSYGFQDATTYSSASNVVWCNNLHLSPAAHEYIAQGVASVLSGSGF